MWGGRSRITPALCMLAMSIATIAMIPNVIRMSDEAVAQSAPSSEIAPHGNLRVALLASNPILMTQKANGSIGGISVDLGRLIAERLRVQFDPVIYADADAYAKSFRWELWDLAVGPRTLVGGTDHEPSPDFMVVDDIY